MHDRYKAVGKGKCKAIPLQTWTGLRGSQDVEAPRFEDSRHVKMVSFRPTHRPPLPHRRYSWYSFPFRGWVNRRAI